MDIRAGYSLVVLDDVGFMEERHRDLIASVRSAVSARGGLLISLSAVGDGPYIPEILDRRGVDEGLTVHLYQSDPDAALDDREAWKASNPALGSIKQISYMESEARRVSVTVKDQSSFRALDLNQPATPGTETLVDLADWNQCVDRRSTKPRRRLLRRDRHGRIEVSHVRLTFLSEIPTARNDSGSSTPPGTETEGGG